MTSHSAAYNYSYGSFPARPVDLLTKGGFDAWYYRASWGSWALGLRLPSSPRLRAISRYASDGVEVTRTKGSVVVVLRHEAEPEWIDASDEIDELLPLRDELIEGDFSALALASFASDRDDDAGVTLARSRLTDAQEALLGHLDIERGEVVLAAPRAPRAASATRSKTPKARSGVGAEVTAMFARLEGALTPRR
ncbi:MAG: hypothetical protein R3A48_08030 [Polyangiales bacterium]